MNQSHDDVTTRVCVNLCAFSNPCTPENAAAGEFYFPHHDNDKFVQCSEWGQCYVMQCPDGTTWNPVVNNCT